MNDKGEARKLAVAIGVAFLVALFFNLIASRLTDPIFQAPNYLAVLYSRRGALAAAGVLNLICAVAMIFIPIFLFRVVKEVERGLAEAYIVFRFLEGVLFIYLVIKSLSLISLSRAYLAAANEIIPVLKLHADAIQSEIRWTTLVYLFIFVAGAFCFYPLLLRTRLVPRFLAIWGIVGAFVLLVGAALGLLQVGLFATTPLMTGMTYFAPVIALNELVLAIWLLSRGFGKTRPAPAPAG